MSYNIGLAGLVNSGKSFSQKYIEDGENTFLIIPSLKATYLRTSKDQPLQPFNVKTAKYGSLQQAVDGMGAPSVRALIRKWNVDLKPGTFKPENLTGNIQIVDRMDDLPIYLEFISKHLPWIHTVILPDFTHHVSQVISKIEFIERRAGNEAYQKFWELAGTALRNYILCLHSFRRDLLIVSEYHAAYDDKTRGFDIFVPSGNMLQNKFMIPSYYDFLFFTDVRILNEGEETEHAEYRFVTRATGRYPQARSMNIFEETYIPNNLQVVCDKVRKYLGLELNK
jgi:hypothetical protein